MADEIKNNEQEVNVNEEVKNEKQGTKKPKENKEKEKEKEHKETIDEKLQKKLEALKEIPKAKRTPEQAIELAQVKRDIETRRIANWKKKFQEAKGKEIGKNLIANGYKTENAVKELMLMKDELAKHGINTLEELQKVDWNKLGY